MEFKGYNNSEHVQIDSNWLVEAIMHNVNTQPSFKKLLNNKLELYLKLKSKRLSDQESTLSNVLIQIKKYDDEIYDLRRYNDSEINKLKIKLTK